MTKRHYTHPATSDVKSSSTLASLFSLTLIFSLFVDAFPLFLGPLLIPFPQDSELIAAMVRNLALLVVPLVAWKGVRILTARNTWASTQSRPLWLLHYLGLGLTSLLFFASLSPFRDLYGHDALLLLLGVVGALALYDVIIKKGHLLSSAILRLCITSVVGTLSIFALRPSIEWQHLCFALSIGCVTTLPLFSSSFLARYDPTSRLYRAYALLLLLTPASIGPLLFTQQLPQTFALLFLVYFPGFSLPAKSNIKRALPIMTVGYCLVFALLALCAL